MIAAPRATPTIGPITTPAIHALFFEGDGVSVLFDGGGVDEVGVVLAELESLDGAGDDDEADGEGVPMNCVSRYSHSDVGQSTYWKKQRRRTPWVDR